MHEHEKDNAAMAALDYVEDGMTLGLGTGSTARCFLEALAEELADGLVVRGVPTSEETRRHAVSLGIPLVAIDQVDRIHLTVDGADEIDSEANLIKGAGGALLREKIVASASDHMLVIADPSKQVERLGACALPVEVTRFGFTLTARKIFDALCASGIDKPRVELRTGEDGTPVLTDGGNHLLDCHCGRIPDSDAVAARLASLAGVVEHGLFLAMARTIIIGNEGGAAIFEH